ncbi:DUF5677 domain-containing protein [Mycetocola lacteus]|uniref:DUF5677 domain-containing protein n=1 Tax=Mycetocola lacteus TaxID=76637 RepID=UPI0011C3562A|nr:DUF5677 domain-containing protein [Mycetocola lacteus]
MAQVSEAEFTKWIRECISSVRDAQNFAIEAHRRDEFLLLHGLIVRTLRYCDAFLLLNKSGFEVEATALARAALEHSITLQWVFLVEGGVERYRVFASQRIRNHYKQLAEWEDHDELRSAVNDMPPVFEGSGLGSFSDLLKNLDDGSFLIEQYHLLSQQVHVTHETVLSALTLENGETGILWDQQYPYRRSATQICAISSMFARWVLANQTNDTELLAYLDQVSEALVIPMNLATQVRQPQVLRNEFR